MSGKLGFACDVNIFSGSLSVPHNWAYLLFKIVFGNGQIATLYCRQ